MTTDVLVVGTGISGALVAERLTDFGLGVVVVDRRAPLAGSTSGSTALLQHELDTPLLELSRKLGQAPAERIWRRAKLVVRALEERTHRLGIEANVEPGDTLYLAGTELEARGAAARSRRPPSNRARGRVALLAGAVRALRRSA